MNCKNLKGIYDYSTTKFTGGFLFSSDVKGSTACYTRPSVYYSSTITPTMEEIASSPVPWTSGTGQTDFQVASVPSAINLVDLNLNAIKYNSTCKSTPYSK